MFWNLEHFQIFWDEMDDLWCCCGCALHMQIKSLSEMGWFLTIGTGSQIVALVILIYKVMPPSNKLI